MATTFGGFTYRMDADGDALADVTGPFPILLNGITFANNSGAFRWVNVYVRAKRGESNVYLMDYTLDANDSGHVPFDNLQIADMTIEVYDVLGNPAATQGDVYVTVHYK